MDLEETTNIDLITAIALTPGYEIIEQKPAQIVAPEKIEEGWLS